MSDTEAWVKIFTVIRSNLRSTTESIEYANKAYSAMKRKIREEGKPYEGMRRRR